MSTMCKLGPMAASEQTRKVPTTLLSVSSCKLASWSSRGFWTVVPQRVAFKCVRPLLPPQARSELLSGLSVAYTAQASEGEHVHGRLQRM